MAKTIKSFNGVVVKFTKNIEHPFVTNLSYTKRELKNIIGISFLDSGAERDLHVDALYYHRDHFQHYRFAMNQLKIVKDKISKKLKKAALRKINFYFKRGFVNNLDYLETVNSIKNLKIEEKQNEIS